MRTCCGHFFVIQLVTGCSFWNEAATGYSSFTAANFDAALPACAVPLLWWIMPEAVINSSVWATFHWS